MNEPAERFLFELVDKGIDKYRKESKLYRYSFLSLRVMVLIGGAVSSAILGFNLPGDASYLVASRNVAILISLSTTVVAGVEALLMLGGLQFKYKVLYGRLRALRERLMLKKERRGHLTNEEVDGGFLEYSRLMEAQLEYWERAQDEAASDPQQLRPVLPEGQGQKSDEDPGNS